MSAVSRLLAALTAHRPGFVKGLQGGADPAVLSSLRQAFPTAPQELLELWAQHDGQDPYGEPLLYNYTLLSAEGALEAARDVPGSLEGAASARWDKAWLPFLDNGGGDSVCIGAQREVVEYWHDDGRRHVWATGLDEFLERIAAVFETGRWHEGYGGLIELDEDLRH